MTDNKFNRRTFIQGGVALAASAGAWPGRAQGRAFPTKPLTLIVPFAPGGNVDITARSLGVPLTRHAGQSVIVDNRAGGGGAVGTGWASRTENDGHSLLVATPGPVSYTHLTLPTKA